MLEALEHIMTPLHTDGGLYLHVGGVVLVSFLTSIVFPWLDRRVMEVLRTIRAVLRFIPRL